MNKEVLKLDSGNQYRKLFLLSGLAFAKLVEHIFNDRVFIIHSYKICYF